MKVTSDEVTNLAPVREDMLTGIALMDSSGEKMIRVNGTTATSITESTVYKEEIYRFRTVYYDGNLSIGEKLNAVDDSGNIIEEVQLDGLTKSGTTWTIGKTGDANKNSLVIRVKGNLTIESGTAIKPIGTVKGLFICVDKEFVNKGSILMNGLACKINQNLYLSKNLSGTFVVPGTANGGVAREVQSSYANMVSNAGGTATFAAGGGGAGMGSWLKPAGGNSYTFGGGTGGTGVNSNTYGYGGVGGGCLFVYANSFTNSGTINLSGNRWKFK